MSPDLDVAVVGAGASGLAVAHALQKAGRSVHVFESADRIGGRMRTLRHDGYLIDEGAEMIATHGFDATWRLIRQVGLSDEEVPRVPAPVALWRDGRAHRNVGRPLGLLTGAGLSPRVRLDLLRLNASMGLRARAFDPDHPESTPLSDMTVAELGRRYCPELSDYVLEPLVGGFFGWDPERSAAAPLVNLLLATKSTANWRTYRDGMDTLARRLADPLAVTTGCTVGEVSSDAHCARLTSNEGSLTARSVVLCVPAPIALDMHVNAPAEERRYLEACSYTPMLRVSFLLEYPLTVRGADNAYAVLIPAPEDPLLAGFTLDHNKAPGRAPAGRGLASVLTRPWATRELIAAPDDEVVGRVSDQAERYLPGLGGATRATVVHRFHHGLPEATPAALRLRSDFMGRRTGTVEYAGDWVMLRPASEGAFRSAELAVVRVQAQAQDGAGRSGRAADPQGAVIEQSAGQRKGRGRQGIETRGPA